MGGIQDCLVPCKWLDCRLTHGGTYTMMYEKLCTDRKYNKCNKCNMYILIGETHLEACSCHWLITNRDAETNSWRWNDPLSIWTHDLLVCTSTTLPAELPGQPVLPQLIDWWRRRLKGPRFESYMPGQFIFANKPQLIFQILILLKYR